MDYDWLQNPITRISGVGTRRWVNELDPFAFHIGRRNLARPSLAFSKELKRVNESGGGSGRTGWVVEKGGPDSRNLADIYIAVDMRDKVPEWQEVSVIPLPWKSQEDVRQQPNNRTPLPNSDVFWRARSFDLAVRKCLCNGGCHGREAEVRFG